MQAKENGESLDLLEKKQQDETAAVKATETRIEQATEANDRYTKSLEKQGHALEDVTEAQRRHGLMASRTQAAIAHREEMERLKIRSQDLRSQAMSHMYFTLGSGFVFTAPIREAVAFEKAMIRVKAMSGANAQEFKQLKEQARSLGASTIYTAKEVAEAQNELATAGYRTNDIITVMPSMLALAESSMTSLARTAEITSEVLQGFRIDVSEMARVGDALTAAYTGSASSLESLGEMLKYVAAPAVDVGSSLEQTLAMSSVLHNAGIKGSMAGTTGRSIFLRLAKPPKELAKLLAPDQMNVKTTDKDGNMRNWVDIIKDINVALKGTGTKRKAAVSKALGGEEHAPGASILMKAIGDGSFQLSQRTFELSPAFNGMAKALLNIPDSELRTAADNLGIKFNRAMSGGGIAASIAGSLKGLKGPAADAQMQKIMSELKLGPKIEDMTVQEFTGTGKDADAALKRLNISRTKALGGTKTSAELTSEIKNQIQTLPVEEKLKYIEVFFSRTRDGVKDLMLEFAKSGKNFDQLLQALNEASTMEKIKKELGASTAAQLGEITSGINDIMITFGEAFIPVLRDMMVWLKPMLNGFGEWLKAHPGAAKGIMMLTGGMFAFSAAMGVAKFALSGFVDVARGFKFLLGPKGNADGSGKSLVRRAIGGIWDSFEFGKIWRGIRTGGWKKGMGALRGRGRDRVRKIPGMKWIGKLLNAGRAVPILGRVAGAIRIVGLAMMGLPIGWIGAAIVGIAAGGYLIYRNWSTIGPKLKSVWEGIKYVFTSIWKDFWTGVGFDPLPAIKKAWAGVFDFLKSIKPFVKIAMPGLGMAWDALEKAPSAISGAIDAGKSVLDAGNSMLDDFWKSFKDVKVDVPVIPAVEKVAATSGGLTQRNVITVHATIHVDAGSAAPQQVASKIKGEIQSAFRNVPSFSFLDPVVVS
jgi:TP901 family phage tail tape measure protein